MQVFVLIDALGWELLRGRRFLDDILPVRQPLRTVLGYSSGAIPSILTGLPPSAHGHWNLFYYDPENSPFRGLRFCRFLPDGLVNHRVGRKFMKEAGRRVLGLGPSFECCVSPRLLSFFNWAERGNIYEPGGTTGAPSIFDQAEAAGVPFRAYSYHHFCDDSIFLRCSQDVSSSAARFYFVYLSELDSFLHMHREHEDMVDDRLSSYAGRLRSLYDIARSVDPEAGFTVFSDHGMTPVRNHYNLIREMEALRLSMPADYLAVFDSTMARFWFFSEKARQAVTGFLDTLECGSVLSDTELRELGILFPDRRYGELIFLLNPGWMLSSSDFHGKGWHPAAMHGYHPSDVDSDAVFLSNRRPPFELSSITDVYECMAFAVGLPANTALSRASEAMPK